MSDWDFLHEMRDLGYSNADILDATACGYAPWEKLSDTSNFIQPASLKKTPVPKKPQRNKTSHLILNKCRIIFFDLEFYVPKPSRMEKGFCYSPWDKSCKLLGGSFLIANPAKDFELNEKEIKNKTKSLWLWDQSSEKELIQKIYEILKTTSDTVNKAHNGSVSPILCGIGIGSSDVPVLFELFKRFHILDNQAAFRFQNSFRTLDLSQLSIAVFNNKNHLLYPKTKHHILNKYLPETTFEDGRSVWDLYETKKHKEIQNRVKNEIYATYQCYNRIRTDLSTFKSLEAARRKENKRPS